MQKVFFIEFLNKIIFNKTFNIYLKIRNAFNFVCFLKADHAHFDQNAHATNLFGVMARDA